MTRIVVDASITAAIILDDEATERDAAIWSAFDNGDLFVPAHWSIEVASLLLKAERRGRVTAQRRNEHLATARTLLAPVQTEASTLSRAVIDLAQATGLTAYDAGYLELAMRIDASLATNDAALIKVGRSRGVAILTTLP